ncbi:hypothetical protein AKAW_10478 [Aspergillus luchuensis IFO 4308]|nr:hypothetical protein AKAW_10478 [Aspergillus luchuensis IFO 4308]
MSHTVHSKIEPPVGLYQTLAHPRRKWIIDPRYTLLETAEAKQLSDMVESLSIPNDCQTDIGNLRGVVERRVDKIARPQNGSLTRIPPVYGCDMLAAHSISDASKKSTTALSPNPESYTWNVVIFFRGRPTIGNTPTLMIPIIIIGPLTVRVEGDDASRTLNLDGQYHLFREEHMLIVEGEGRMAALCDSGGVKYHICVNDRLLRV